LALKRSSAQITSLEKEEIEMPVIGVVNFPKNRSSMEYLIVLSYKASYDKNGHVSIAQFR